MVEGACREGWNISNTPLPGRPSDLLHQMWNPGKRLGWGLKLSEGRHQKLDHTTSACKILGIQIRKLNFLLSTRYRSH